MAHFVRSLDKWNQTELSATQINIIIICDWMDHSPS